MVLLLGGRQTARLSPDADLHPLAQLVLLLSRVHQPGGVAKADFFLAALSTATQLVEPVRVYPKHLPV